MNGSRRVEILTLDRREDALRRRQRRSRSNLILRDGRERPLEDEHSRRDQSRVARRIQAKTRSKKNAATECNDYRNCHAPQDLDVVGRSERKKHETRDASPFTGWSHNRSTGNSRWEFDYSTEGRRNPSLRSRIDPDLGPHNRRNLLGRTCRHNGCKKPPRRLGEEIGDLEGLLHGSTRDY